MTKSERHDKILEIIKDNTISRQSDLTDKLKEAGCFSTQATVSRDLQELRITKLLLPDGTYKYAISNEKEIDIGDKLEAILRHCLTGVKWAQNIVVLKTMSGAAQAVGYALDSFVWEDILGTICGDDTIMVVVRSERAASRFCAKLSKYIDI